MKLNALGFATFVEVDSEGILAVRTEIDSPVSVCFWAPGGGNPILARECGWIFVRGASLNDRRGVVVGPG